jgi:hypothetical protein
MADIYADSSRGVYIPQFFAESVKREYVNGVTSWQWEQIELGPENESYWDAWDSILNNARIILDDKEGFLYQDGDLFVIWGEDDPDYKNIISEY